MSVIRYGPVRYGIAALAALAAVWLRWALEPLIGTSVAFITIFPAMMLVAVTLGAGPGLLCSALGIVLIEWFFIGPIGIEPSLSVLDRALIMLSTSAYVGWVSTRLRAAREQAEAQVAQLRHQSELMNSAGEALIVRELGGAIRFWNQGAAAQYGWSSDEALGQLTYVLLRTEGTPLAEKDAQLAQNGHWEGELTHTTRDGRRVIVESRQTATHASNGQLLILESDRDITARKVAEAERQKFVSLTEQSTEFIGICDMHYQPFYVNTAGLRLLGLDSLEQACNKPVPEFFFEEDRHFITEEFFPRVFREGQAEVEIRFRHFKTGAAIWMIYNVFFLHDESGKPTGLATVSRNITERKRIEHERETTVELLRLVTVSQDLRQLARSAASFFQKQSGCEAVGLRLSEGGAYPYIEALGFPHDFVEMECHLCARDATCQMVCDSAERPVNGCLCGNVLCGRFNPALPFFSEHGSFWTNSTTALLAGASPAERKARTLNRCNREGYESVALLPLRVGNERLGLVQLNDKHPGKFTAELIALWERLADQLAIGLAKLRAEAALRENESLYRQTLEQRVRERTAQLETANQELETFCYSVSHDLRTPLRTIDGFSQAALEDCGDRLGDTGRDYLSRVRSGCRHMDQLIDDLLNLSRVSRDQMRFEPVDLTAIADAAVNLLRERAQGRKVDVRITPGLAAVGDAHLLRAALFNLLENAWKFSSRSPAAIIEIGRTEPATATSASPRPADLSPRATVFFVRDNGVGFDMQYAGKLFKAFQRLHTVQEFPGTGIGLATVARVIQRHGGRIWAEASLGRGATFYFTLEPEPPSPTQ